MVDRATDMAEKSCRKLAPEGNAGIRSEAERTEIRPRPGRLIALLVGVLGLAACGSDPSVPTASNTTAVPGGSLADVGVNRALKANFIGHERSRAQPAVRNIEFLVRGNANPENMRIHVDGDWYTLRYVPSEFGYIGGNGSRMIEVYPQHTTSENQLAQVYVAYYANDLRFLYAGYGLYGIPTSGLEIRALGGTATYTGRVGVAVWDDQLNFSDGKGIAVLRANFGTDMIEGELDLSESGFSDPGHEMTTTRIIMVPSPISGAQFIPDLEISATDFGFDAPPSVSSTGRFYGVEGSSVGGQFSGQATRDGGATAIELQGAFSADQ